MRIATLALIIAGVALAGCYHAPVKPNVGYLYSDISAPITTVSTGDPLGTRVGRATATGYLGLVSTGDCSVAAAARNGGITQIHQIDYEFYNMLGIVQEFTTVVIGE